MQLLGNLGYCPKHNKLELCEFLDGDYYYQCGYFEPSTAPLPRVSNELLAVSPQDSNNEGYTFKEMMDKLSKKVRAVRYAIATSSYPVFATGMPVNGHVVYNEELVDLTAKTGIYPQCIGGILTVTASEEGRIMQISTKTVINDINSQKVSGWCSGGYYYVDLRNGLDRASLHKPVDSTPLYRDTLELSQEIRRLMASNY